MKFARFLIARRNEPAFVQRNNTLIFAPSVLSSKTSVWCMTLISIDQSFKETISNDSNPLNIEKERWVAFPSILMSRKRSRKVERHLYVLYAVVDEVSFKVHDLFHLQSTFEIYPAIYEAMKQDVIRKKDRRSFVNRGRFSVLVEDAPTSSLFAI